MAKKASVFKSAIEEKAVAVKEKIVTARIPLDIFAEYEKAVDRVKVYDRSVSLTKVIILALQEATACITAEADELDAAFAKATLDKKAIESSVEHVTESPLVKCKCGLVMVDDVWKGGENDGKPVLKCPARNNDNKADHDFKLIQGGG